MKLLLRGPVGDLSKSKQKGNFPEDVKQVKQILRTIGVDSALADDGNAETKFTAAVKKFQQLFMSNPDGRVDTAGGSLTRLIEIAGGKAIVVDLRRQVLDAYLALSREYHFDCASGDESHPTPSGYFKVEPGRKYEKYRSKTYDAQMDYAMFFHRGYAIHMAYGVTATSFLKWAGMNSLGSHGCVRLNESDAKQLFKWTPVLTPVLILPAN